jgi:di/tripeptidase
MTSAAMTLRDSLRTMMLTPALSGREERMMRLLENAFGSLADQVETDRPGNVIARFDGTDAKAPRVMLFAHMDQLGMLCERSTRGDSCGWNASGACRKRFSPELPCSLRRRRANLPPA